MNSITISIPKLIIFAVILALLYFLFHLGWFELFVAASLLFWSVLQIVSIK